MNLELSKHAHCPYCGKWSVVRIQTLTKLRGAEKEEPVWGKSEILEETEEEKLRKEIDESKYRWI